ncbi:hypothetical protein [Methylobacterium hispanicum]|nr:hypothetical protein [Methylobacterium hispanicum]
MTSTMPQGDPDPFAAVSVHGLWPLVADEGAPGGLRFADLRTETPADCVSGPDELPAAEISIHTFAGTDARDAWIAAAREFGGNGLALVQAPFNSASGVQAVLAIRFDRTRAAGADLDDAVVLRRDAETVSPGRVRHSTSNIGAAWRARHLERIASDRDLVAWKDRWKSEIEAIGSVARVVHFISPDKASLPLEIDPPFGLRGRLTKSPGEVRFVLDARGMGGLAACAYAESWRMTLEARGWEAADAEAPSVRFAVLGSQEVARIAADIDVLQPAIKRLSRLSSSYASVREFLVDPDAVRVLRRLHAGLPIASSLFRDPAAQISPKTGEPQGVAASRVERLFKGGFIEPVWWRDRNGGRRDRALPVPALDEMHPVVWGLTVTGTAFVEERFEDAAETHAEDAATALAWLRGRPGTDARTPEPHEGPDAIARRVRLRDDRLVEVVSKLGTRFRPGSDLPMWPKSLAQAATALAAGILDVEGGRLVPRAASPDVPGPGA